MNFPYGYTEGVAPTIAGETWPYKIYSAVIPQELAEVNGSRSETYTPTEFTAHIEFICPWDYDYSRLLSNTAYNHPVFDIYTGYEVVDGENSGTPPICEWDSDGALISSSLSNVVKNYYNDYFPALPTQVAVAPIGPEGITVDSYAGNTPSFQPYTLAKLAVDYKGRGRPGNLSVNEQVTPSFGMRQLPSWGYYWRSDGSPVLDSEAPGKREVTVKISRTLSGVRRIPWWFYSLAGCVNGNAWTDMLDSKSYLPGTLLFIPTGKERQITMARDDDDNVWNLQYDMEWNPIGWNNFRRPQGVDSMMYDEEPVIHYPSIYFPTLLVDPNAPPMEQLAGEPYGVYLQNNDGSFYFIAVDWKGTVIAKVNY